MRNRSALFSLLCCLGCSSTDDRAGVDRAENNAGSSGGSATVTANRYAGIPEVVGDSLLRFPGGAEYAPGFRNVSYIGQVPASKKAPFIIVRGIECSYCDAPPSVLMRSPSDGPPVDLRSQPGWYPYPGRIVAWDDPESIISEARVFWGECLPDRPPALLFYNTRFVNNEPAEQTVRVTFVSGDSLLSADGEVTWSSIEAASERVRGGGCHEIEPENRFEP